MFNSKIKKENEVLKSTIEKLAREQRADNFNFALVLEKIQEINNSNPTGKGAVLKGYLEKKEGINDVIDLAKQKIDEKIEKLDIDPQY